MALALHTSNRVLVYVPWTLCFNLRCVSGLDDSALMRFDSIPETDQLHEKSAPIKQNPSHFFIEYPHWFILEAVWDFLHVYQDNVHVFHDGIRIRIYRSLSCNDVNIRQCS